MGVLSSETSVLCVWEIFQLFKRIRGRLTTCKAYDTQNLRMVHLVPVQYQFPEIRGQCVKPEVA